MYKILRCGRSRQVIEQCYRLGVIDAILPALHRHLASGRSSERALWERLEAIDGMGDRERTVELPNGRLLAALLSGCVETGGSTPRALSEMLREAAAPLTPSNNDLHVAAAHLARRRASARP